MNAPVEAGTFTTLTLTMEGMIEDHPQEVVSCYSHACLLLGGGEDMMILSAAECDSDELPKRGRRDRL
jgi:hypothetical protein